MARDVSEERKNQKSLSILEQALAPWRQQLSRRSLVISPTLNRRLQCLGPSSLPHIVLYARANSGPRCWPSTTQMDSAYMTMTASFY